MTDRLKGYQHLAAAADQLKAERDRLIHELWHQGYGVTKIAAAAGLSRRATYDIIATTEGAEQ